MTTGRINQVTILKPVEGPRRARLGGGPLRREPAGGGVVVKVGAANRSARRPRLRSAQRTRVGASKAIQLPPLSSPRDGPPQGPSGREPARDCDMRPSGGGCLSLVTSASDGYQPGLTPNGLGVMVAIGQSSTDSTLARNGDTRCGTSVADRRRPRRLQGRETPPPGVPDDPAEHHHQEPAG